MGNHRSVEKQSLYAKPTVQFDLTLSSFSEWNDYQQMLTWASNASTKDQEAHWLTLTQNLHIFPSKLHRLYAYLLVFSLHFSIVPDTAADVEFFREEVIETWGDDGCTGGMGKSISHPQTTRGRLGSIIRFWGFYMHLRAILCEF